MCRLVSPVTLHTFFGIRELDYDARKAYMVDRACKELGEDARHVLKREARGHDIADAMGMAIWYSAQSEVEMLYLDAKSTSVGLEGASMLAALEGFRYDPSARSSKIKGI